MIIYLASTSPRRISLLRQAGYTVRKLIPSYVEVDKKHLSTGTLIRNHAIGKALSAAGLIRNGILVSADTLVVYRGRRIGKPRDMKDAYRILSALQGRTHTVCTGVAILKIGDGHIRSKRYFSVKTRVTLKPIKRQEMASYFRRIGPLDKAGAYAIQVTKNSIVSRVDGSFTNAVGLPMEKLKMMLDVLE